MSVSCDTFLEIDVILSLFVLISVVPFQFYCFTHHWRISNTSLSQMTHYFVVITFYDKLQSAGQLDIVECWSLISFQKLVIIYIVNVKFPFIAVNFRIGYKR